MTHDRRRQLIALLDQYPLERDLFLHDGRRESPPREEFADKIEAIFRPASGASITTIEGQAEYYADLVDEVADENKRLARDLAEYEAHDTSLFQRVMEASAAYVERFGGTLSLEGAMKKMHEEWAEMHQEIDLVLRDDTAMTEGAFKDTIARELLAKEAIDLLVTIGGVLRALKVDYVLTEQAARATLDKLDGRTSVDYAWNGTTVERIGKVAQS